MSAPQTSEGPLAGGPIAEQMTEYEAIVGNADVKRKRFATAQATAALRGITLRRIEGDFGQQYIATFHALTKAFDDLAEVESWLERVDGRRVEQTA